jgi:uncharacterized protein
MWRMPMPPVATTSAESGIASRELAPNVLQLAIDRIVSAVGPERIVLFGSAARGTMSTNSDVDLLVIKKGVMAKRSMMAEIYRHLRGVPEAFDIVVATPEEVAEYGEGSGYVLSNALREGRTVYAA